MPWDVLCEALQQCKVVQRVWKNPVGQDDPPFPIEGLVSLRKKKSAGSLVGLFQALLHSVEAKATDRRDKLYSLLGLVTDPLSSAIVPDYTKGPTDMVEKFTNALLEATQLLEIICLTAYIQPPEEIGGRQATTWQLQWLDLSFDDSRLLSYLGVLRPLEPPAQETKQGRFYRRRFRASKDSKPSFTIHHGALEVYGLIIDEISKLERHLPPDEVSEVITMDFVELRNFQNALVRVFMLMDQMDHQLSVDDRRMALRSLTILESQDDDEDGNGYRVPSVMTCGFIPMFDSGSSAESIAHWESLFSIIIRCPEEKDVSELNSNDQWHLAKNTMLEIRKHSMPRLE